MAKTYKQRAEQTNQIQLRKSIVGRDIGPLPRVKNPKRRAKCKNNLRLFCETYFKPVFNLGWSEDHLKVIELMQIAILKGGLFAVAMPRGSGKSSLSVVATIWALLYGHRRFVALIAATQDGACDLLEHIINDLEHNDLLANDFPESCYPIRRIDGITQRAAGQLLNGERTEIGITAKELILPTVKGSCSSGARVKVAGITGRIRGLLVKQDGKNLRPDLVLLDDVQTDESARSPKQVRDRLTTVNGAVLGLAGPGKTISGVMPITVIVKGDVADQVLDRETHPEWQGVRTKMLESEPTDLKLWEQYAEHRAIGMREGRGLADATAFYRANQIALDAGAKASWPERFNPNEASAIQSAMNLKIRDEYSFYAEYQNDPKSIIIDTPLLLTSDQVASKAIDGLARQIVPDYATTLTAMIDVQGSCLFWAVVAWGNGFTGHIVDYGCFPDQPRNYFFLREVSPTLADLMPRAAFEGQLMGGLEQLTNRLLEKDWTRENHNTIKISRLLIDSGYRPDIVNQFAKQSKHSGLIIPSKGYGIGADRKPYSEYREEKGVRTGWNWRHKTVDRVIDIDTNSWKTFLAQRLSSSWGDPGNLSLFKHPNQNGHKMFAEHLTSEYPVMISAENTGRKIAEWKAIPNRENHYLDCCVGAAVGASEQGVWMTGHTPVEIVKVKPKRKLNFVF